MKTLHTLDDGTRLLLVTAAEWDGMATAVELAYEDEESIPPAFRLLAASLFRAFHKGLTPPQLQIVKDTNAAIDAIATPTARHVVTDSCPGDPDGQHHVGCGCE